MKPCEFGCRYYDRVVDCPDECAVVKWHKLPKKLAAMTAKRDALQASITEIHDKYELVEKSVYQDMHAVCVLQAIRQGDTTPVKEDKDDC